MSDEQGVIDANEELEYYVGMKLTEVTADLTDKGVPHRVYQPGSVATLEMSYKANRVNLVSNLDGVVISAVYG